jgi:folate-dependent tRNA-U54 methylase TrmFO/GidA
VHYISNAAVESFQPVNMSFGILSDASAGFRSHSRDKKERHRLQVQEALETMDKWIESLKM